MDDDRRLTVIVVPHGDLETRSFVLSYGKLKFLVVTAVALLLAFGISLAIMFPVMAQAARVQGLERDLQALERERARVAELARTLEEVEEQYERVRRLLGADSPTGGSATPLLPPLRGDTAGDAGQDEKEGAEPLSLIDLWPLSERGYVTRSLGEGRSRHPGLDIAVPSDSRIRAAGAGTVRVAGTDDVYGHYVVIDHGGDLESVYGHASRIFAAEGDRVRRGQVIGLTGSTGRSTAPHLHFEVRQHGRAVDPGKFVRQP